MLVEVVPSPVDKTVLQQHCRGGITNGYTETRDIG